MYDIVIYKIIILIVKDKILWYNLLLLLFFIFFIGLDYVYLGGLLILFYF